MKLKSYTQENMELIVAQGHPQKQHTALQNRKITFFHTDIYSGPDSSLCCKGYQKHDQENLSTQTALQQAGYHTVWLSSNCRGTPIYGQF